MTDANFNSHGVSFLEAREIIKNTIAEVIDQTQGCKPSSVCEWTTRRSTLDFIVLPPLCCTLLFAIAIAFDEDFYFFSGLVTSIAVIFLLVALNYAVIKRYYCAEKTELHRELLSIVDDYISEQSKGTVSEDVDEEPRLINAGHSHISIVSVFRDGFWQRIPMLLLVAGDIIALMAGDVAPSDVYELIPEEFDPTVSSPSPHRTRTGWATGALIARGHKIHFRQLRKTYSTSMFRSKNKRGAAGAENRPGSGEKRKYRALSPDSVELLVLSGDMRCFCVADTPMRMFCKSLLSRDVPMISLTGPDYSDVPLESAETVPTTSNIARDSVLRLLFRDVKKEGLSVMAGIGVVVIAAAVIRIIFVDEARDFQWSQTSLIALSTVILAAAPLSLPLSLFMAEALATANGILNVYLYLVICMAVLATVEAMQYGNGDDSDNEEEVEEAGDTNTVRSNYSRPMRRGHTRKQKRESTTSSGSVDVNKIVDVSTQPPIQAADTRSEEQSRMEDSVSDEYGDEDIDDRAEKIADEASIRIPFGRQLQYTIHVIETRLGLQGLHFPIAAAIAEKWRVVSECCRTLKESCLRSMLRFSSSHVRDLSDEGKSSTGSDISRPMALLPVPLGRTRFLEILGGVTMVCFVDDDIICEGYSVTEEIFLLNNRDSLETSGHHGSVLDLHANPQASGSRFENPKWWTFLPSLKPIGLNAMLTCAPHVLASQNNIEGARSPSMRKNTLMSTRGRHMSMSSQVSAASYHYQQLYYQKHFASEAPSAISVRRQSSFASTASASNRVSPLERVVMEKSLVGHVRHSLPLESLRELAEEIGFVTSDIDSYRRLMEINVIAPRLGDVKLMEDAHAWGQEETRRRGSLTSQITATIVQDRRTGGLQLLSQGNPALVLSYCKEYWDGTNIAPLTNDDRKELYDVYERWDLEDFDVVAFGYSPVPVNLQEQIEQFIRQGDSSGLLSTQPLLAVPHPPNPLSLSLSSTVYFVDPCTDLELQALATRGRAPPATGNASPSSPSPNPPSPSTPMRMPLRSSMSNEDLSRNMSPAMSDNEMIELSIDETRPEGSGNIEGGHEDEEEAEGYFYDEDEQKEFDETADEAHRRHSSSCVYDASGDYYEGEEDDIDEDGHNHDDYDDEELAMHPDDEAASPERSFDSQSENVSPAPCSSDRHTPIDVQNLNLTLNIPSVEDINASSYPTPVLRPGPAPARYNTSVPLLKSVLSPRVADTPRRMQELRSVSDPSLVKSPAEKSKMGIFEVTESEQRMSSEMSNQSLASAETIASDSIYSSDAMPLSKLEFGVPSDSLEDKDSDGDLAGTRVTFQHAVEMIAETRTSKSVLRPDEAKESESPEDSGTYSHESITSSMLQASASYISTDMSHESLSSEQMPHIALKKSASLDQALHALAAIDETVYGIAAPPVDDYAGKHTSADFYSTQLRQSRRGKTYRRGWSTAGKSSKHPRSPRSLSASLWSLLRQQVFLGMTASAIPVRPEIPQLVEDLTQAGVRFVYFSPRNMRRSKKVAEKIGLQTEWNCAISLRALAGSHDPHRLISNYADWDVKARLPHGIKDIKRHLREVDNVPLLVSLFTDATPTTVGQMVDIFREHGEIVLTIGSSYRAYNQPIFRKADMGIAINMIPGDSRELSCSSQTVVSPFPEYSSKSLCQSDLLLVFRLVSLHTCPILQTPYPLKRGRKSGDYLATARESKHSNNITAAKLQEFDNIYMPASGEVSPALGEILEEGESIENPSLASQFGFDSNDNSLSIRNLLEALRKGRVLHLNAYQIIAMMCVSCLSIGLWPVYCQAVPMSVPPVLSPPLALLFICVYLPVIGIAMLFSPADDKVMKNTPRKNILVKKPKDVSRFAHYLAMRVGYVCFSVFIAGWLAAVSDVDDKRDWVDRMTRFRDVLDDGQFNDAGVAHFWHVQDIMSSQLLIALLSQIITLLHRGQTVWHFPNPMSHPEFYLTVIGVLSLHVLVMFIRALGRDQGLHRYAAEDTALWIVIAVCPVVGIFVGTAVNAYDNVSYRRYLQFLRLEFDTRLGMHSPR